MAEISIEKMAQYVARKAIQELRDNGIFVGRWIPVSERLPELNIHNTISEDVLVFDGCDIRVGEYRKAKHLDGGHWRVYGYFDEFFDVIAWMPLPEPYKEVQDESKS